MTDTIIPAGAAPAEIDRIITEAMGEGRELYVLDRELLASLDPDLIVTQDLCRVCALPAGDVDAAVAELGCRADVFRYDPMTLLSVLDEIDRLAQLVDAPHPEVVGSLRDRLRALIDSVADREPPKVLLLEWTDPAFTAGHWIPDQITAAGGQPVLAHPGGRSSALEWEAVADSQADVLLVAPCGFDKAGAQAQLKDVIARPELQDLPAVRSGRTHAIDADAFVVRPGPRLIDGVAEMIKLIHPEAATV